MIARRQARAQVLIAPEAVYAGGALGRAQGHEADCLIYGATIRFCPSAVLVDTPLPFLSRDVLDFAHPLEKTGLSSQRLAQDAPDGRRLLETQCDRQGHDGAGLTGAYRTMSFSVVASSAPRRADSSISASTSRGV